MRKVPPVSVPIPSAGRLLGIRVGDLSRHLSVVLGLIIVMAMLVGTNWLIMNQISPVSVGATFAIIVAGWLLFSCRLMRMAIGEDRLNRSGAHWGIVIVAWIFVLPTFALYVLVSEVVGTNLGAQLSVTLTAPVLGGLALNAASGIENQSAKRELLCVAQKFIVATIFFVVFAPSMYFVDQVFKVDPNTLEFTTAGIVRAIYFWFAAISFFGGVILFLVGLVDSIFALISLKGT